MGKLVIALLFLPLLSAAQLLPEALGPFARNSLERYEPPDLEVFREFGFEEGQRGIYLSPQGQTITIEATRYYDDTGAFSAFQWLQMGGAQAVENGERAVRLGDRTIIHFGNYLVEMRGVIPLDEHVEWMLAYLPRVQLTADPPVLAYVPQEGLVRESQRHILGPVALGRLAPEIPPSVAAFRFGTEAQFARYQTAAGSSRLTLFSYPSAQIARAQMEQFDQLDSVVAKRSGSLIAAVIAPSADEAERLLAKVRYAIDVTVTPREEQRHDNLATLIIDIMILCLILAGLMIVGGVLVAGARILAARHLPNSILASPDDGDIIKLDIKTH